MEVNKPSVLIIEDDEILLKALAKGFLRSGFRVATATHPREAVHLSEVQFFDALLVDCLLPSHSGVELARELLVHQHKDCCLVLMSGVHKSETFIADSLNFTQACRYFTKPFELSEVVSFVLEQISTEETFPKVFSRLLTQPKISAFEVLTEYQNSRQICGWEIPVFLGLLVRTGASQTVELFENNELVLTIKLHKGQIYQIDSYEAIAQCIRNIQYDLVLSKIRPGRSYKSFNNEEFWSWLVQMVRYKLPQDWIISELEWLQSFNICSADQTNSVHEVYQQHPLKGVKPVVGHCLLELYGADKYYNQRFNIVTYILAISGEIWFNSHDSKSNHIEAKILWEFQRSQNTSYFQFLGLASQASDSEVELAIKRKRVICQGDSPLVSRYQQLLSFIRQVLLNPSQRDEHLQSWDLKNQQRTQNLQQAKTHTLNLLKAGKINQAYASVNAIEHHWELDSEVCLLWAWAEIKWVENAPLTQVQCTARLNVVRERLEAVERIAIKDHLYHYIWGLYFFSQGLAYKAKTYFNKSSQLKSDFLPSRREIQIQKLKENLKQNFVAQKVGHLLNHYFNKSSQLRP